MLIVGLVALLQIVYLPGALLRRCFPSKESDPFEQVAYTFGLSLIANTWLVAILVTLHVYSNTVVWAIVLAEITALIFLVVRARRHQMYFSWGLPAVVQPRTFNSALATILALTTVAIFAYICYLNWGTVFSANDDVASWDRWATEWAAHKFPTRSSWYPQLIPANWSLTYVLLGRTDVKMFAKATTTLYPLLTLFLFGSLAIVRRNIAFLFGAAMYGWLLLHNLGIDFMMIGYADVPVAFFGFLTFHAIYRRTGVTVSRDDLLLSIVFCTGTLITKQGGVYALIAVILYAIWIARRRPDASPFASRNLAAAIVLFALCFAAIWYGGKALQVYAGHDYSNLSLLTHGLYHGQGYIERLIAAGGRFWHFRGDAGPAVTLFSAVLLLSSLLLREARWITVLLILPFLLLWAFLFSYEIRNASLIFPLVALVSGLVIDRVLSYVTKPLDRIALGPTTLGALFAVIAVLSFSGWVLLGKPGVSMFPDWALRFQSNEWIAYAMWFYSVGFAIFGLMLLIPMVATIRSGNLVLYWPVPVAGLLALVAILGTGKYRADTVIASQHALERRIGTPAINERIYATVQAKAIHQPIMTDYWYLGSLPGLESLFRPLPCGAPCTYEDLRAAAASQPDAGYFLMYDHDFDPDTLAKLPGSRGFHTIFTEGGVRMLAIDRVAIDKKNRPPEAIGALPASGAGSHSTFQLSYSDPDGISDITSAIVIINRTITGTEACYFQWYRATGTVSIANDSGVGWADEQKTGGPGAMHNSQCELYLPGTSMTEVDGRLELKFDLRFQPSFRGPKHVYTDVFDDYGASSGYRDLALWVVK